MSAVWHCFCDRQPVFIAGGSKPQCVSKLPHKLAMGAGMCVCMRVCVCVCDI